MFFLYFESAEPSERHCHCAELDLQNSKELMIDVKISYAGEFPRASDCE